MKKACLAVSLVFSIAVAGCAGGSGPSAPRAPAKSTATPLPLTHATSVLEFTVYRPVKATSARRASWYDGGSNGLIAENDYTDASGMRQAAFVYANVTPGGPLCPSGNPPTISTYVCRVVVPIFPGIANTFTVWTTGRVPDNANAAGYGTNSSTAGPFNQFLSIGSTTVTPVEGAQTMIAIVLNPVVHTLRDRGPAATRNYLHQSNGPQRYIVPIDTVNPSPTTETFTVEALDYASNNIGTVNNEPYVAPNYPQPIVYMGAATPQPGEIAAHIIPAPFVVTTPPASSGVSVVVGGSLTNVNRFGEVTLTVTHDGRTLTPAQVSISNGHSTNSFDFYGQSYSDGSISEIGDITAYEVDPLYVTPQTITLSAAAPSASITVHEPAISTFNGGTGFYSQTPPRNGPLTDGNCVDALSQTVATYSIGTTDQVAHSAPIAVTLVQTPAPTPGSTCTFRVKDDRYVLTVPVKVTVQ